MRGLTYKDSQGLYWFLKDEAVDMSAINGRGRYSRLIEKKIIDLNELDDVLYNAFDRLEDIHKEANLARCQIAIDLINMVKGNFPLSRIVRPQTYYSNEKI